MTDYDESQLLTSYILEHYHHLLTPFEQEVLAVLRVRHHVEHTASIPMRQFLTARHAKFDRVDISEAVRDGDDAFRRRVRDRVLADHAPTIIINRCPVCQRLVRTPRARLCVWCGATWYDTDVT